MIERSVSFFGSASVLHARLESRTAILASMSEYSRRMHGVDYNLYEFTSGSRTGLSVRTGCGLSTKIRDLDVTKTHPRLLVDATAAEAAAGVNG